MMDAGSSGQAQAFDTAARKPARAFRSQVRDIVLVLSSSRSGSSYFMELISHASGLVQLQGEINPLLRLAQLDAWATGTASDMLDRRHCSPTALDALDAELAREAGSRAPGFADPERDIPQFVLRVARRLALQWPTQPIPRNLIDQGVMETLRDLRVGHGWTPSEFRDPQLFTALLLRQLREQFPHLNPHYYDLNPKLIATVFPGLESPEGPPAAEIVEEPPFIYFTPWRLAGPAELSTRPLVMKSPSNAYRLEFFREVFPHARLRILHLTRNPAAAINGLIDGWRFRGFHSHHLPEPLEIAGYSDLRPRDARWWKFDLPPGWQAWSRRPLPAVCGFQWRSAHQAVLNYVASHPVSYHRLRFEDLIGPPEIRDRQLSALVDWLGVDCEHELKAALANGLRPVMGTQEPRQRRWLARAEELRGVLEDEATRQVTHALAYDDQAQWI